MLDLLEWKDPNRFVLLLSVSFIVMFVWRCFWSHCWITAALLCDVFTEVRLFSLLPQQHAKNTNLNSVSRPFVLVNVFSSFLFWKGVGRIKPLLVRLDKPETQFLSAAMLSNTLTADNAVSRYRVAMVPKHEFSPPEPEQKILKLTGWSFDLLLTTREAFLFLDLWVKRVLSEPVLMDPVLVLPASLQRLSSAGSVRDSSCRIWTGCWTERPSTACCWATPVGERRLGRDGTRTWTSCWFWGAWRRRWSRLSDRMDRIVSGRYHKQTSGSSFTSAAGSDR